MQCNVGKQDKIARFVIGLILVAIGGFGIKAMWGIISTILLVIGVVLIVTAAINFCPLYHLLKINTHKDK